jgi:Na+/melibiose symporter-like transporter
MNLYHIEEKCFQTAQVLYLIWNAISDPLFAYIQDGTNFKFTRTRRESIKYSGPLFALSFLLPWIPWGDNSILVGLHLVVSLFIWDTMFTFVGLAQCALFTELSHDPSDRIKTMVQNT